MSDSDNYSDFEESFAAPTKKKGKKNDKDASIERIYQKKTQLEHILLRPDTYIGSVELETKLMWVWDEDVSGEGKMVLREISYVPGLYKIFDEILVNAADNKQRDKNMNCIRIDIDVEENEITIYNNGKGIPVVEHKQEKVYVPTLIFGHLLTSSNYDDEQKKVVGGRNGYGAKLCNIFSKKFKVETSSKEYRKAFSQLWLDNMKDAKDARIVASSGEDFTRITFQPDLSKFDRMQNLDRDIVALFSRRAFDVAGSTKGVKVYLNGKRLAVNGFKDYVELFVKDREDDIGNPIKVAYEVVNDRWEIAATVSDRGFQQVSFVNSIATTRGGKHVDYVADQIVSKVADIIKKKNKAGVAVKPFQIKNHLWIFVNCLIENPTFDSQTKETMTLQSKSFGSKCSPSEKFFNTVIKVGVVEAILTWVKFKAQTELSKKCHAKKQSKLTGVPKLEDANDAGTKNSIDCTLILTEGDSAKSLVVAGLGVVGRDKYGVFPLKGKILNVREASHKQILENAEINNIIKILGLQYKKKYDGVDDLKTLRYGKVMIMTDQDQDGSHIKGLLINFIHHNWPSLLKLNFLEEFITPIVKASKGNDVHSFYSLPEFEEWKKATPNWKNYRIKYYKGLGTSTSAEAKEYFSDMQRHRIRFTYTGQEDDHFVQLAFAKKMVEQRKDWLTNSMEDRKRRRELGLSEVYLYEKNTRAVTYKDFVNKELILFSNMDNERSIPSLIDGLKPGQRKVLYTCFKRNDKREVKVAQLAGSVGEHSAYHHGEASLMSTIINLAQNFVGSNNINLLQPIGQFGTRLQGGKDAASPRYIFTMLSPLARKIFSSLDDPLYNYLFDDNLKIEPEYYVPILPMVLVNGAEGIGTGWSTKIPNYNPRVIIDNLQRMLRGQELRPMKPWFKGFQGSIEQIDHQRFVINGEAALLGSKSFEITELPVRVWTQTYKEQVLEPMLNGSDKTPALITDYKEYHTNATVKFVVTLSEDNLSKSMHTGLHKMFKIQTTMSTTSMVLFDHNGCLRRYETPEEIFREFFPVRLEYYCKRKAYYEGILEAEALKLENQARFIIEKNDRILIMENVKRKEFIAQLIKRNYDSDPIKAWKQKNADKIDDYSSDSDADMPDEDKKYNFDYLIDMTMRSMLREKIDELLKLRDLKKEELHKLRSSTPEDLWRNDLQELLEELDRVEAAEKEAAVNGSIKVSNKLKTSKTSARPIKSMKMSAQDFLPSVDGERIEPKIDNELLKKVTGLSKKITALEKIDKEIENGSALAVPAKKTIDVDSDSDIENEYVPLAQRVAISPALLDKGVSRLDKPTNQDNQMITTSKEKKAPAKKRPAKPKENATKKAGKAEKGAGKKKKKKEEWETSSDDDKSSSESEAFLDLEDDNDSPSPPPSPKPKAVKPKPAPVAKHAEDLFHNGGGGGARKAVDSDEELFNTKPQEKTKTSEELFDSLFTPTKPPASNGSASVVHFDATIISNGNANNNGGGGGGVSEDDSYQETKKKQTKTKKSMFSSSEDSDSDAFSKKNNNNHKQIKKKKTSLSDSDDDDLSDFDDHFKPKAKAKPKKAKKSAPKEDGAKPKKQAAKPKKKKKSSESESDLPKKKSKAIAKAMDDTLNEIPPEFRTKTGRIRQPVSYNFGGSSDDDY